ncbi:MAG TPA: alcohol dehydrogenase catalytic domain-containing protein, partial [Mammaliicoccus lentus]
MKAAVWYGQKDVRVEDRKSKELQENEVKVKVSWAGICGTDLHEYLEGPIFISTDKPDPFLGQKAPVTLGHEFAGVVDDIGSKVTQFNKGDRVVINPTVSNRKKEDDIDLY